MSLIFETSEEQTRYNALRMLAAAFPANKVESATIAVYMATLADLDAEQLRQAVLWCVTHCRFFPTVAEIREAVASSMPDRPPTSTEAWGEVMHNALHIGSWGKPTFSHPLIQKTVDAFGWREICLSEGPSGVLRAQFIKAYDVMLMRHVETHQAITDNGVVWQQINALAAKMKALPGPR